MGRDAIQGDDNSLGPHLRAPLRRPSILQNRAVTNHRHPVRLRRRETRVPAIDEIPACYSARRGCANILCHWMAPADDGKRVSSMAPLAISWWSNLPALLQRLADLGLGELLLRGKIFTRIAWLAVFRDELRRLNVLRFPIEIKNLIVRPQIILGVPMAIQAPRHAVGLGDSYCRHVTHRAVTTKAADAAIHMR